MLSQITSNVHSLLASHSAPLERLAKQRTQSQDLAPTAVYDTYWYFATERQQIFRRRGAGLPGPWTSDPILQTYKFTNAYRASDRTSQFLIRRVIYEGDQTPEEIFFRTILFKLFNRVETWLHLTARLGQPTWRDFSLQRYDRVLLERMSQGQPLYSAAYIIPSSGAATDRRKYQTHLSLLQQMMRDDLPLRISDAHSLRDVFILLRSYPGLGDFLAYQFAIDLNYSVLLSFSEMDFVVAGPGAREGIRRCFKACGVGDEEDVIRWVCSRQEQEFSRLGLTFRNLGGRALQLIDCQNLFCEVAKYARVAHPLDRGAGSRFRIKQRFRPSAASIAYWYPPKWRISDPFGSNASGMGK